MALPVVEYLLWAPLGERPVREFAAAYAEHPPGAEHELVIAACGADDDNRLEPLLELLEPLGPTIEYFEGPRIDLFTHRELIERRPQVQEFVFLNSYSRPLGANWLRYLLNGLRTPGVGIAGAGGTYETRVATTPYHLGFLFLAQYQRFPNTHIRTSSFAISRSAVEQIDWFEVRDKSDAWRLESGRKNLTSQLVKQGLRPVVVGRDGRVFEADDWRASATYRAGGQQNLLIADLRSDDYENADAQQRAVFETWAWGSAAEPG